MGEEEGLTWIEDINGRWVRRVEKGREQASRKCGMAGKANPCFRSSALVRHRVIVTKYLL